MLFSPIAPMLLTMGTEVFDDENFIFEPKWDGWRIQLHKQGDRIEAFTRNGNRITAKFPELKEVAATIKSHQAILDCEAISIREGKPNFDDISYRGRLSEPIKIRQAQLTHPATFVAFDVLATDSDHTKEPLRDRKQRLQEIVPANQVVMPTLYVEGEGQALHKITIEKDLEGIVAKRADSRYLVGERSPHWIKIKNFKTIDAVILGYRMEPTFALIVGLHFPTARNKPVATVEFGFTRDEKRAFLAVSRQIHTHKHRQVQWIEPQLCCRVQYLERTDMHMLRIVSFKGFLFDKNPDDCRWAC